MPYLLAPIPAVPIGMRTGREIGTAAATRLQYRIEKAADLLNTGHPLHTAFVRWLAGRMMTKRKASEFRVLMHAK